MEKEDIKKLIYEIRGKKVILDRTLSSLFNIETRILNQRVKRNIELFNDNDYFQMNNEEFNYWKSQNMTSNKSEKFTDSRSQIVILNSNGNKRGTNIKYLPYVFTSDGIKTLVTILRKENVREIITKILQVLEEENEYESINKCPKLQGNSIRSMIYEIRGKQVMLDSDLAVLYQCKNGTKEINQAVKNNLEKFPERFSWLLNDDEFRNLRSKFLTSSLKVYGGRRYTARVFTEEGIVMLATILKSQVATQVSIAIMDTFVLMRRYISGNECINRISNIETKLVEHDIKFEEVFNRLDTRVYNHLFFEGQIYDAFSLLLNILNEAKESIIIIDNYIDKNILDVLAKIKVKTNIITSKINEEDVRKYKKQYHNITIIIDKTFHDRFIIIDGKILYHSGASFKDLGKKCFAITKINEEDILNNLLLKII